MKKLVYRDPNGVVVNIGPWDLMEDEIEDPDTGEVRTIQHNPIPDGVTNKSEEVIEGWDGGLYVKDDPRATK